MIFFLVYCLLWLCVPAVSALSLTGSRLLVVLEDSDSQADYSKFLDDLKGRGYKLDIQSPKSTGLSLFHHGNRKYDNVVMFPPKSKGYGPNLSPQLLTNFLGNGGNILLLTSPSAIPEQVRDFAREMDIDVPLKDHIAVDHFNYDTISSPEWHDVVLVSAPAASRKTRNYFTCDKPIAFRGTGHALGNRPLLFPILRGSRTSYTYDSKEDGVFAEDVWTAATQQYYVTAFQTRNNARFTLTGSASMFSNKFFDLKVKAPGEKAEGVANRQFAAQLTQWTFQETGVVKTVAISHHLADRADAEVNPSIYRVKNDVTFKIELSEWVRDHWTPFQVPSNDSLQLEFTMLDPYYRVPLLPTAVKGDSQVYSASFQVPDQHGVFAFKVNYKRPFVSYIDEKYQVTVRHFAHDEYTRSWAISGAWVWIAGIGVTTTGWTFFCALWLWSVPPKGRDTKKVQ